MWLDNFNEMRKKSGLSLDEISVKSGVPKGTLAKITSGVTKAPPLETMRKLVYSMGYTLDDLDGQLKKIKKAPLYSSEAMQLAQDYDTKLDVWGKKQVRSTADIEIARCAAQKEEAQKLNIAAEVASYQAELELQAEVEGKSSASDGFNGTIEAKLA